MKERLGFTAALLFALGAGLLAGCGPAYQGKVSGYALEAREALFSVLTDDRGAAIAALVVMSDQQGTCATLAARTAPPQATFAAFTLTRHADGRLLAPDVGHYVVGGASTSAAAAEGRFIRTDANGTNSIPSANHAARSGLLEVTDLSLERGTMGVRLDAKFGAQADPVTAAFRADRCVIATDALRRGFLFDGAPATGGAQTAQAPECADYIACVTALSPSSASALAGTYGPGGSCWSSSSTAEVCAGACREGLRAARQQGASTPAACFR